MLLRLVLQSKCFCSLDNIRILLKIKIPAILVDFFIFFVFFKPSFIGSIANVWKYSSFAISASHDILILIELECFGSFSHEDIVIVPLNFVN